MQKMFWTSVDSSDTLANDGEGTSIFFITPKKKAPQGRALVFVANV